MHAPHRHRRLSRSNKRTKQTTFGVSPRVPDFEPKPLAATILLAALTLSAAQAEPMTNRLANETSPYLLQHQTNPVDWYPWGPEALERAKEEDKPIFLSIGYSACHWCHVMEHESFENEAIAAELNDKFVCIKVDREERPDLDQIYMNATQLMTGRGGWPMSVFLTPDLKPFYAGTYWPPTDARGMPGFDRVIAGVAKAWAENRGGATEQADKLAEALDQLDDQHAAAEEIPAELLDTAARAVRGSFDPTYGGFGQAPKFPQPMNLRSLLRHWSRTGDEQSLRMVTVTLDRMAAGGIYDHLGGGFARYSVDARWLVPHFEKMLYDNALLAAAYLEAYQATGNEQYATVVRETLDYTLRDMTDAAGGFYSTEDADSEGVEGKFYVWTPSQLEEVLGQEAASVFARVYDITDSGNFEHGQSILNLPKSIDQQAELLGRDADELRAELAESRRKLFAAREERIHPGKDDKVIVAWNGLMIDAMARAGATLNEPRYTEAAAKAARFILAEMRRPDGRLLHTWRGGEAKLDAYLDDYACLANSLVTLYESTFEAEFLDESLRLTGVVTERFACPEGGFYYTADDHEQLITRTLDFQDNAVPSGNAMAATAMARLGKLTGDARHLDAADATVRRAVGLIGRYPTAAGQMQIAADLLRGPTYELVVADETGDGATLAAIRRRYLPNAVLASATGPAPESLAALLAGKEPVSGQPVLYVCEGFLCHAPAIGAEEIAGRLESISPSKRSE